MIFYSDITVHSTLTVGVNDTGHDVKFFGATTGKYMLWDQSADSLHLPDSTYLFLGSATTGDLQIYHNGTDSAMINTETGDLYIINGANDKDIIFQSDNGSGGVQTYFYLDGSQAGHTTFPDNSILDFGSSRDMQIYHTTSGNNSYIVNYTGSLIIQNSTNDDDIIFKCDNGSGGNATYFTLDGSAANGTNTFTTWEDQSVIALGAGTDLKLWHNGTNSYIKNETGSFNIVQAVDDGDLVLKCDNGSGGTTAYLTLDGSASTIEVAKNTNFAGNVDIDGVVNIALNNLGTSDPFVEGQLWRDEESGYLLVSAGEGG